MYSQEKCFENRYRLRGILTAKTPLHVGDGEDAAIGSRQTAVAEELKPVRYSTFATASDENGKGARPMIPGSTLKGVLRAWLKRRGLDDAATEALFGTEKRGGKAEFHDAVLLRMVEVGNAHGWWDATRGTCLAPGVSLDAETGTAREHLLYYTEYAPPGTQFRVEVTAQNLEPSERDRLVALFRDGFSDADDAVTVGAETADGWGAMQWSQGECAVIEHADVRAWLDKGAAGRCEYRNIAVKPAKLEPRAVAGELILEMELRFRGGVLVNDPSQFRKRNAATGEDGVGHATVMGRDGRYFLPGSSVRGALRGQTQRIWQTIAHGRGGDRKTWAGASEAKRKQDLARLAAIERMFGATGWRSPIRIGDFAHVAETGRPEEQEFVAVDRFTGGSAEERKFKAKGLYAPVFRGTVRIRLAEWERAEVGGWALLLLLFLLRDLVEGDVQFGFGASKGYGACVAAVQVKRAGEIPAALGGAELEPLLAGVVARRADSLQSGLLADWERELLAAAEVAA